MFSFLISQEISPAFFLFISTQQPPLSLVLTFFSPIESTVIPSSLFIFYKLQQPFIKTKTTILFISLSSSKPIIKFELVLSSIAAKLVRPFTMAKIFNTHFFNFQYSTLFSLSHSTNTLSNGFSFNTLI